MSWVYSRVLGDIRAIPRIPNRQAMMKRMSRTAAFVIGKKQHETKQGWNSHAERNGSTDFNGKMRPEWRL